MDFSPATLFVVQPSNTYPTTGSTNNLTAGQFGIFKPDYTPATAGNIASAAYIYFAQGRIETVPLVSPLSPSASMLGSKRSDRVYANKVINWYKLTAHSTAQVQATQVSAFNVECGQQVSVTLRLFSSYINVAYFNGLTRTVTVVAPCCACGVDPCTALDPTALVDAFVASINTDPILSQYVFADRTGTGTSSVLNITGLPLTSYGTRCDPSAFPFEYDRMYFYTYAYIGAPTSTDFLVFDLCDQAANVNIVQRATYPRGTAAEVIQMEKDYVSYQTTLKHLFEWDIFNNGYASYVVAGTFYDTYFLRFYAPDNNGYEAVSQQYEDVIVAVPTGSDSTNFSNIITVFLGNPNDESGSSFTTSTSTTTSSSTSSTSTTLIP